ncbi:MAG: hypothetical protein OXG60_00265 [Chloroflexi bacterium]|nr:hypothetical protein [Chloroflexota bacterium]
MNRLGLLLAIACVVSLCGIASTQDRGWATAIAWSPNGETIAVGSTTGVWFFDNDFVEIGFVATPQLNGYPPTTLDWNAASDMVVVANAHQLSAAILVVGLRTGTVLTHIEKAPRSNVRWHPEEDVIVVAVWAGIIALDAISGEQVYIYSDLESPSSNSISDYWAVCWLSGEIVAAMDPWTIWIVDIARGTRLRILSDMDLLLYVTTHSGVDCHGRDRLVSIYAGLVDLETGETIKPKTSAVTFHDYGSAFVDVAWSPDGKRYLTNGNVGLCRIAVFDGRTNELLAELQGSYSREIDVSTYSDSVTWRPDGSQFAVVGQFDIRVWDARTYELVQRYDGFEVGYHYRTDPDPKFTEADRLKEMLPNSTKCPGK